MPETTWREHCAPIIARVLAETAGQDEKAIKKALFDAYPYHERSMHPYKIWLSEIAYQRGKKARPVSGVQAQAQERRRRFYDAQPALLEI